MPLLQKIDEDLKSALKASDQIKVSALRMLKASLKNRQIEKRGELSDEDVIDVLVSLSKQRRESIEMFSKGGREELAEKEKQELSILQSYLPSKLSNEEIDSIILEAIKDSKAKSVKDMGSVMKIVMPRVKGMADGKYVNQRVKELLEKT